MAAFDSHRNRLPRWATSLLLMTIRGVNTGAKFALALYTARYLGLSDLGIYGLIVAVTTMLPAFAGLGTSDWIVRQIAGEPTSRAAPLIMTRLAMTLMFHAICQPITFAANAVFHAVSWPVACLISLISLLDHLAGDACEMLIFRGHAILAHALFFIRSGLWPLVVIAAGFFVPELRTLSYLLAGWVAGLVLMWAMMASYGIYRGYLRYVGFDWPSMRKGIRASVPFYIKDMSIATSLYLDRFLVSAFLGLELTGVYTFFWSIANVIHNLALNGIVQPQVARLILAARAGGAQFRSFLLRIEAEVFILAILMSLGLVVVVPLLIPYLGRPLLETHLLVLNIIVAATLLRLAADSYNFVLLALHHDKAMAMLSMAGVVIAAVLYMLLIPMFGLEGAATAYLVTGAALLVPRILLSRKAVSVPRG